jgi:hypothetical protein
MLKKSYNMSMKRMYTLVKAIEENKYQDLGKIEMREESTLDTFRVTVTPYEGVHKDLPYELTLCFKREGWPKIMIDSPLFDQIKTKQYIHNRGKVGEHKGICIQYLGYGYLFHKYFPLLCDSRWDNYLYYVITMFNNIQDFENGIGLKSDYKEILGITI